MDVIIRIAIFSHCFPGDLRVRVLICFMKSSLRQISYPIVPIILFLQTHYIGFSIGYFFDRRFIELQSELGGDFKTIIETEFCIDDGRQTINGCLIGGVIPFFERIETEIHVHVIFDIEVIIIFPVRIVWSEIWIGQARIKHRIGQTIRIRQITGILTTVGKQRCTYFQHFIDLETGFHHHIQTFRRHRRYVTILFHIS